MIVQVVFIWEDPYYEDVLTRGKIYDAYYDEEEPVYSSTGFYYTVKNDIGHEAQYYYGMFKTLDQYRQEKINKILD
jgi:hypothetical protein